MIVFNLKSPPLVDVPGSIAQGTSGQLSEAGQPEAVRIRLADILRQAQQREDCMKSADIRLSLEQVVDALAAYAPAR